MSVDLLSFLEDEEIPLLKRITRVDRLLDDCSQGRAPAVNNAKAALIAALNHPADDLRWIALKALERCFFAEDETLKAVFIQVLDDADHEVRAAAISALTTHCPTDEEAIAAVARLIKHPDEETRSSAIYHLGKSASPQAADILGTALAQKGFLSLHSQYWLVRGLDAAASKLDVSAALPAVLARIQDLPHPESAIAKGQDAEAKGWTQGMILQALNLFERYEADGQREGLKAVYVVANRYQDPALTERCRALSQHLLSDMVEEEAPPIAGTPPHPETAPFIESETALETKASPTHTALVNAAPAAADKDHDDTGSLPFYEPPDPDHTRSSIEEVAAAEVSQIRAWIKSSLDRHDREAVPKLVGYITHHSRAVQIAAIRALGLLGDGRARLPLEQASRDPNPAIRKLAHQALEELKKGG